MGCPVVRHPAMLDQPAVAVGHQRVAIATGMVEADMGDQGEIRHALRLFGRHVGEQHVGKAVSNDRLYVGAVRDVPTDITEKRYDLGSAAQRLKVTYLEDTVGGECLRKFFEP